MIAKWMLIGAAALVVVSCGSSEQSGGVDIDCTDQEFYDQVNDTCVPRFPDVNNDADAGQQTDAETEPVDMAMEVDEGVPPGCDVDRDGALAPSCGGDDCDDNNPRRAPAYAEFCDELDNNCNGRVNDGIVCEFYGHSGSTLYRIDPFAKVASEVAADLPNLQDIDTDPDGTLYGITFDGLFRLDASRGEWSQVGSFGIDVQDPNGLAIDSRGDIYATAQDKLFSIDSTTGAATLIGTMPNDYYSSGDCVVNKRDTLFMTSKHIEGNDTLLVLRTNDASATEVGLIGDEQVFGLTSAWGRLYGLTRAGDLIEIDSQTGASVLVHSFQDISWFGAASTPER